MSLTNVNPAMHRKLVKENIVCFENLKIWVSLPWSLIMIWRMIDLITRDWMGLSCACFQICISVYQLYVIVDFIVLFSYIHITNFHHTYTTLLTLHLPSFVSLPLTLISLHLHKSHLSSFTPLFFCSRFHTWEKVCLSDIYGHFDVKDLCFKTTSWKTTLVLS